MVRERVLVAEIKGDGDRLSEEQAAWIAAFASAGVEAHVWTPKDWREGRVEEALARRLEA